MVIAITGGGTGGHLAIARAFGEEIKNLGHEAIFIGSSRGQDRAWFENSEIFSEKYFLKSSGVVNKGGISKIFSLLKIFALAFSCRKIFKKHGVNCVISVGGYSAAPASFGAIGFKIPLFLHEQNAVYGKLNKILKPFARKFYSSYFEPKFDYPIASVFFQTARVRKDIKSIIFLGGSQGANFINDLAINLAPDLVENGYKIIHQCGEKNFEKISKFYAEQGIEAEVVGFYSKLYELIAKADICIGRSGASTLWELCANRLPAIFIPFPHATGDHQFYNAKFLADNGLCKILRQDEVSGDKILKFIKKYNVFEISEKLTKIIKSNGSKIIIEDILNSLKSLK